MNNKRIEKLADQCQLYDGWFTQQGKIEKFAQLIVQECAGIITSQDVDPAFKNRMAWAIKEHFGVEE